VPVRAAAPDDAAVIERSLDEPERFAVLFDRHAPYIHRYVARRLGGDVADDVVAETFLTAFGKRGTYDLGRPDARPWLYGIATNLIGTHRRAEVRQVRLRERQGRAGAEPFPDERIVAQVSAQARRPELAAALAALSPQDRDVLLLIAWEQLSYDEVARALGIPVGTVRSRLHRARRTVRTALGAPHTDDF
jgi:RNA polymerase sigma factor (sigma-70 family)